MALFQMVILFIFLFGGEYMIMEPEEKFRYNDIRVALDYEDKDWTTVFPGRLYKLNGDDLYQGLIDIPEEDWQDDWGEFPDEVASRHMTFIFNLFIWLQIVNMIAARKIHDELNICDGFFRNPAFLVIWVIIVAVNFLIIQTAGAFFKLHPDGLSVEQHILCIGVSLSVLVCNAILKCLPDDISPKLGPDSVDDKRKEDKEKAKNNAVAEANRAV